MKFQKAKDRLKELSKGETHIIQYELTEWKGGRQEAECWMCISRKIAVRESTFQDCLDKIRREL
jgi:hypothetical protein